MLCWLKLGYISILLGSPTVQGLETVGDNVIVITLQFVPQAVYNWPL